MSRGSSLAAACALLLLLSTAAPGRPPASERIARFAEALPKDGRPGRLRRLLETLPGRIAIEERAEAIRLGAIAGEERRAVKEMRHRLRDEHDSLAPWLRAQRTADAIQVERLRPTVQAISALLMGDDAVTDAWRTLLSRPDAAEVLYRKYVRPRLRPDPLSRLLGRAFVRGDDGRLVVPAALGASADSLLDEGRAAAAAVRALSTRLAGLAGGLEAGEPLARRLEKALEDESFSAWLLGRARAQDAVAPFEVLADRVAVWLEIVRPGIRKLGDGPRTRLASLLDRFEQGRAEREEILIAARLAASDVAPLRSGRADWPSLLLSSAMLALVPEIPERDGDPIRILLDRSPFGRWLRKGEGGAWVLHRHFGEEAWHGLQELRRSARKRRASEKAVLGLVGTPWRDPHLRALAARRARREAAATRPVGKPDGLALLLGHLEREIESTGSACPELDALEGHANALRAEVELEGASTTLDLPDLAWRTEGLHLLRSSAFYNPRTRAGRWLYHTQFPDHHAARLFGVFGWDARVSKSLEDFLSRLRRRKAWLESLARTHEKLIVVVCGVPTWLSRSPDRRAIEGGWLRANGHPPKDPEIWDRMVREMAILFRDVEGAEIYYEFWNEPDGQYWQADLAAFLDLYGRTARVIRAADPDARIGGPAVNQWDRGLRNEPGKQDSLVIELIRAAGKRKLPLDFVSWHHFGRPVSALREAKAAFEAELRRAGFETMPELVVSEWTTPARGTALAAPALGEAMLGFLDAGVDVQTIAAWEEFHAKPEPRGFAPWGIVTQQGVPKNTWYVHRFLDRMSRSSTGVAVLRTETRRTIVVSRKPDGVLDLLVWDGRPEPPLAAAWESLKKAGFTTRDGRPYGILDRLERAILHDRPRQERWREAFREARRVHESHPVRRGRLVLKLTGARRVEVISAASVRMAHRPKAIVVLGDTVTCPLRHYEVLRLVVRVDGP